MDYSISIGVYPRRQTNKTLRDTRIKQIYHTYQNHVLTESSTSYNIVLVDPFTFYAQIEARYIARAIEMNLSHDYCTCHV